MSGAAALARNGAPSATARPIARARWRIDVSEVVPLTGRFEIAVDVVAPAAPSSTEGRGVLVCLPGGFLSRRYFDLGIDGDRRFSFAEAMAAHGWITFAFDHLGIGESTKPDPLDAGYRLGVEEVARTTQCALEGALERLRRGDPDRGIPAVAAPMTIGVGHSMGSSLTVEQQALARPHAALVLFSFTTAGLPRFLDESLLVLANDPARARVEIGDWVRRTFGTPYPPGPQGPESDREIAFGIGTAPASARKALQAASTDLLGVGGLLSMIPGGFAPSAAGVDVPVLIALGDHDLHDEHGLVEMLPRAPAVTTFVQDDCWHCHFVSNERDALFARVADWLETQVATSPSPPIRQGDRP